MSIEHDVSYRIYRMMELYRRFSDGLYEEMNSFISEDFQGKMYMPWMGEVEHFDAKGIKEGNRQAADFYKGKNIEFDFTGLSVVPQSDTQAAGSYEVIHRNSETGAKVRALALEVWRKESDGEWRIVRWYEEKGMRI
ncbi:hypothetical protein ACFO3D_13470 [Virgibacillus kekensis]|uniref:DUF4440 domain-containing protein n=1 Tax=Virgibacillus kekensis TaxID=202261 RepID=A0ABV9DLF0_9BACI